MMGTRHRPMWLNVYTDLKCFILDIIMTFKDYRFVILVYLHISKLFLSIN